jgi:mRNA interferase MazF
MKITRYAVYWANLDPVLGSEISKTRPVVIVSDNAMNANLRTVVACPLTTSLHPEWRGRVQVVIKGKRSEVAVDQIRTLSKKRLYRRIGPIDPDDALKIRILISEMYGNG